MLSGRSRGEYCEKKMLKKDVGSRYVYENKQISDKLPGEKSDIYVHLCVRFGHLRLTGSEFCRNSGEFTVKRRHFLTQSFTPL